MDFFLLKMFIFQKGYYYIFLVRQLPCGAVASVPLIMKMTTQDGLSSLEGLPKSFVQSMRTLFDIMDDQNTGFVKFTEIERRWHEDGTQGLPQGVLNSLRKVTPPNGLLTFERFCGGLKMSLLKSQGKSNKVSAAFNTIHGSSGTLSPTNSLEAIGPLTASSPQSSPQHRNRPLSAPLLDQEPYMKHPVINTNLFNSGTTNNRKSSGSLHHKIEKNLYYTEYPSQSHIPLKIHKQQVDQNMIYATKSDIRMGIGGIKGIFKGPSSNAHNSYGPPKPPRKQEGENCPPPLQVKSYQNDSRMTSSLERESRSNKRWNGHREEISTNCGTIKNDRGGSLERLLDSSKHRLVTKEPTYGPPQSRTGVRSAIQSWFKEKSKSDLNHGDTNNNYRNRRFQENIYKETSIPKKYQPMEYRGTGDGGNTTRIKSLFVPPLTGQPPIISRGSHLPLSTHVPKPSKTKITDKSIYGKVTVEKVVPINYEVSTNRGVVAPGIYVAPQPPQVAIHKKTNKKKEPRRHTLQNGIDQNVMKKLRQLEAERDMLYQGMDVVEKAKNWYKQQLQGISERMHYLPFGPNKSEPNMELQREKLHFQLARIHEINAHLRALMDASDKGLPTHMNLAIRSPQDTVEGSAKDAQTVNHLKQQNKLLTDEVGVKSDKITNLEREKAALLRELFQARAKQRSGNADSTFM